MTALIWGIPLSLLSCFLVLGFHVTSSHATNECEWQLKCHACIQTKGCMWCPRPKINEDTGETYPNCQPTTLDSSSFCELKDLENPQNEHKITKNIPLTRAKKNSDPTESIIQLVPQEIKLKLRKETPEIIDVTFQQADDYPVDLYYLMDLSNSMKDDKAQLASLGGNLTDTLRNLTSKFTIGFGSFVDKVMMPFADSSPEKINSPCESCNRSYAFRNNMPLNNNGSLFMQRVHEAPISGNLDDPEGGFDALMQAMVCKEQIRWRNQSRRIIVFSTDDKFHLAGHGRLAGIIRPNDEACHLNEDQEYDAYDVYDYPSIAQINKVAKKENINIIFAVSKFESLYRDLSKLIDTASYGLMKNDSSNVIELVVDQYNQISSRVRLTDNSTNSPVSIRYKSNCLNTSQPLIPTQECLGMSQGSRVTFSLEIEVKECPKDQDNVTIEVKALQESLILEIQFDCSCNCQSLGRRENSSVCTYHGSLVCGVCECFSGYKGKNCMCSVDDESDGRAEDDKLCKAPDTDQVCSGQGYCQCGACACQSEEITGKFCECNSQKCLSGTGQKCSGHGTCDCDSCSCDVGYQGQFCECHTDDACIQEGSVDICSGKGTCQCGRCRCNNTFSGNFCQECMTCETGKCEEFQACALSFIKNTQEPCNHTRILVDSLDAYITKGAQECTFLDEEMDGCSFRFSYLYKDFDKSYDIHILTTKECLGGAPIMGIIIGSVAGIVIIAVAVLFGWKLTTDSHYKRECEEFVKQREMEIWSVTNDLYQPPIMTVQNPAYCGSG